MVQGDRWGSSLYGGWWVIIGRFCMDEDNKHNWFFYILDEYDEDHEMLDVDLDEEVQELDFED